MGNAAMTALKVEVDTFPPLPNLLPKEQIMAIQVEELIQAVAEGVLRAVEARGASSTSGAVAPAAVNQAGSSRADLIPQLSFEVLFRAGGIPPFPGLVTAPKQQ
jgi:hypothetical protein